MDAIHFEKIAACDAFLEGPGFSPDGALRMVDLLGGGVFEVREGACIEIAQTGGMANGSRHDSEGRLWIADAKRGILRLEKGGSLTTLVSKIEGKPLETANDLVFDHLGGLYFTVPNGSSWSERTGLIYYLPPEEGAVPRVFRSGLAFPNGIALSPDGQQLFAGMFADKAIIAFASETNNQPVPLDYRFVDTHGGIGPDGIIIDSKGRMIWANFGGGSIGLADLDGYPIGEIRLPPEAGTFVTNLTEHEGAYYLTEASKGEVWKLTGL